MKALIFAAGLGERMRPLTEHTPKPLLVAGGKPLITWHIERLAAAGIREIIVNTSWLAEQFPQTLGNGARWGVSIRYLYEGPVPLETGGGMLNALPLLGDGPFLAVNGDIWTDYDFATLPREPRSDAHLVLVDNPPQHPSGDFALIPLTPALSPALVGDAARRRTGDSWRSLSPVRGGEGGSEAAGEGAAFCVAPEGPDKLTFSGIGLYRPSILQDWRAVIGNATGADETPPRFKLAPLLRAAMQRNAVTGEYFRGVWTDVGTPERLSKLDVKLRLQEIYQAT